MAFEVCQAWLAAADNPARVEYLLGVDDDDPALAEYVRLFTTNEQQNSHANCSIIVARSRTIITAMNNLALEAAPSSEIMISVSDDVWPQKGWDTRLLSESQDISNLSTPRFFGVGDGVNEFGAFVIYVANRAYYNRLGWVLCPEYDGLYADSEMSRVAKLTGTLKPCPGLRFEHQHFSKSPTPEELDATYQRHNNSESQKRNWAIFERRLAKSFDIPAGGWCS